MSGLRLDVTVDNTKLILKLRKGHKRLAYAVANALNDTAKHIQRVQRRQLRRRFEVRQKTFMERQIAIIKPFASAKAGRPFVVISVGRRKRLLLPIYEAGGAREPVKGKRAAVPIVGTAARPSWSQPVPPEYRFTQLRFRRPRPAKKKKRAGSIRRGPRAWQGQQGTYMIPSVGVFKRERERGTLIYIFKAGQRLKRRLGWIETARRVIEKQWPRYMKREIARTLRRHTGR